MASDPSSPRVPIFTWAVIGVTVALLVVGAAMHGFSLEVQQRFWSDMFARFGGPMTFRFFLQPTMGAIAAFHDGLKDAREGTNPSSGRRGSTVRSRPDACARG